MENPLSAAKILAMRRAFCHEKTGLKNFGGDFFQNMRQNCTFWGGQKVYPHYPQSLNPPKVDGKTTQNQGVFNIVHKLCTKLSTILGIEDPKVKFRDFLPNAQNFTLFIISYMGGKRNMYEKKLRRRKGEKKGLSLSAEATAGVAGGGQLLLDRNSK